MTLYILMYVLSCGWPCTITLCIFQSKITIYLRTYIHIPVIPMSNSAAHVLTQPAGSGEACLSFDFMFIIDNLLFWSILHYYPSTSIYQLYFFIKNWHFKIINISTPNLIYSFLPKAVKYSVFGHPWHIVSKTKKYVILVTFSGQEVWEYTFIQFLNIFYNSLRVKHME